MVADLDVAGPHPQAFDQSGRRNRAIIVMVENPRDTSDSAVNARNLNNLEILKGDGALFVGNKPVTMGSEDRARDSRDPDIKFAEIDDSAERFRDLAPKRNSGEKGTGETCPRYSAIALGFISLSLRSRTIPFSSTSKKCAGWSDGAKRVTDTIPLMTSTKLSGPDARSSARSFRQSHRCSEISSSPIERERKINS